MSPIWTPNKRYPGFRRLFSDQGAVEGITGIESTAIPVVIVEDVRNVVSPGGAGPSTTGLITPVSSGTTIIVPDASVKAPGSLTLGFPLILGFPAKNTLQTYANNTGVHSIQWTFGGQASLRVEDIRITFTTSTTPPGSASNPVAACSIYPLSAPVNAAASWNDVQQFSFANAAAAAVSTAYYMHISRNWSMEGDGEGTGFPALSTAVRTRWLTSKLPDLVCFSGGGIVCDFATLVAAGGGLTEVSIRIAITAFF